MSLLNVGSISENHLTALLNSPLFYLSLWIRSWTAPSPTQIKVTIQMSTGLEKQTNKTSLNQVSSTETHLTELWY